MAGSNNNDNNKGLATDPQQAEMKAKLDEGKIQMRDELYPAALSSIMKAINLCPCSPASHGKDKSCNILQCINAIRDPDPAALYRVATGPCSCGFAWPSCTLPLHLQAVDTLAECLERTKHHAAAFSAALGLIRLDPASAIGYCRVARIIRYLVKHHQGSDQHVARSLSVILRDAKLSSVKKLHDMVALLVRRGLHNTEVHRHSPVDKYHVVLRQIAHSLNLAESRKDPFTKLPREITGMICSYLDMTALIRSCRVSKLWRQVIEADKVLWSTIRLHAPRGSRYFGKFLQRHRNMRGLVIEDISNLAFSTDKLNMILRLPKLQHLQLGSANSPFNHPPNDVFLNLQTTNIAKLKRLSLKLADGVIFTHLVQTVSPHLEVLDTSPTLFYYIDPLHFTEYPKLKKLSLTTFNFGVPYPIYIDHIAKAIPNLEHLHLDGVSIQWLANTDEAAPHSLWRWPSLRSLTVLDRCKLSNAPDDSMAGFGFPFFSRSLRVLEILCSTSFDAETLLRGLNPDPEVVDALNLKPETFRSPNLEVFRCRAPLSPASLQRMIEPAVQNGALKVLEISGGFFSSWDPNYEENKLRRPLEDYPFASSDQIHTLGMYDFNWGDANHYTSFDGQPFLDWLECFPNVKTVAAYPGEFANVAPFLMKLICHPGIEAVYQDSLRGVELDEARMLAKKRGVKLYHRPGHSGLVEEHFII